MVVKPHLVAHLVGLGHTPESAEECLILAADYLTAAEAARLLGVKVDTINKYARRGYLTPARKLHGRLWLYDRAQVERLAADPPRRTGRPKAHNQK